MKNLMLFGKAKQLSGVFKASTIFLVAILAFAIYDFILPIFTEERADSFAIVGIIVSLVYVASLLSEIPIGLAVDKYGRVKILAIATTAMGILGLTYFFTNDIILMAFLSLVFGTVAVAFWVPSAVLIRDYSPRKMLGQAEGIYLSFEQLGWIIGPIIAGFIATQFSDRHNFLLVAVFMFIAVGFSLIIFKRHKAKKFKVAKSGHKHKASLSEIKVIFKEYSELHKFATPIYILSFLAWLWIAVEWTFIPLLTIEHFNLPAVAAGLVLGAMMAVEGLLYYSSGFVMDKIGKKYIITAGFLILFSSAYFMFLATSPAIFIFAALIAAASVSWILPGIEAILTEIVPSNLYGEMSGLFDTSKDFGQIVGPIAGGLIAVYLANPLFLLLLVAILAGVAALLSGGIFWPDKSKGKKHG